MKFPVPDSPCSGLRFTLDFVRFGYFLFPDQAIPAQFYTQKNKKHLFQVIRIL